MPLKIRSSHSSYKLANVGYIHFRRNIRAKRLTITIKPQKGVFVTVPSLIPLSIAKRFVEEKQHWITEKLTQLSNHHNNKPINSYNTKNHKLVLIAHNSNIIKSSIENSEIRLFYPINIDIENRTIQDEIKAAIEKTYRKEANEILPARLDQMAKKHGLSYNNLRIKNIKSRWGSCSAKNNINLSIYLMKLPDDLIDYVILHELVHTIHKNHGPEFWSYLNNLTGNAKQLAARVKKYRTGI